MNDEKNCEKNWEKNCKLNWCRKKKRLKKEDGRWGIDEKWKFQSIENICEYMKNKENWLDYEE